MFPASRSSIQLLIAALTVLFLSGLCAAAGTPAQASPTPQASLITVASFNGANGEEPHTGVTFDSQGNLFGTTYWGGENEVGAVYEITKGSTTITDLVSFNYENVEQPQGGLTLDSGGNLFGTTYGGGVKNDGTVYEIAKGTTRLITLASFNGTNGKEPYSGVMFDKQGNLFGTTFSGGANDAGTVFEIVKGSRRIKTLASFAHGNSPAAGVTLDGSGNLFGTTYAGSVRYDGTVYEIAKGSTTITVIAFFNGADGASPSGVTFDSQGNLFGTTFGGGTDDKGTVYEIAKGSTAIVSLVSFTGTNGSIPSGVTFDRQGNLFGTTEKGGTHGTGTVFEIVGAGLHSAAPGLHSAAPKLFRKAAPLTALFLTALFLTAMGLGGPMLRARKHTQSAG